MKTPSSFRRTAPLPQPWLVFAIIIGSVFVVEFGIMEMLSSLWPKGSIGRVENLLDSTLLIAVTGPLIWMLVVRPLRRLANERAELLGKVLEAQEAERRRIAHDLHDEIGQSLTSLLVGLRTLTEATTLEEARERACALRKIGGAAHDEIRRLARGLRPSVLDEFGLSAALVRLAEEVQKTHALSVHPRVESPSPARLPEPVETAVYRIAQEALTNVVRHAQATQVELALDQSPRELRLTVADDGVGLGGGESPRAKPESGLGLRSIRERAELLGGAVELKPGPSGGAVLVVTIPL